MKMIVGLANVNNKIIYKLIIQCLEANTLI